MRGLKKGDDAMAFPDRPSSMAASGSEATGSLGVVFSFFAGVLLIIRGFFEAFAGLGAVIEERFYEVPANYAYHLDVPVWGWIHLIGGAVAMVAGVYVFTGRTWARILGIAVAAISAIINFFLLPYHTAWPMVIIALDLGIIWALAFYGGEDVGDS
jgi:hypothetical protein